MLPGAVGVVLGLGVAAIAYSIGRRRGPAPHDEQHAGHLSEHAMWDQVIHLTLKK